MNLLWNGTRFELHCHKEDNDLPAKAGFTWVKKDKLWVTNDGILASSFKEWAEPVAAEEIDKYQRRVRFSAATDSTLEVPCPITLAYYPYQKAGIDFARGRENTLIGDGMRLGKSVQAIGLINLVKDIESVLIFTKASLKINVLREVKKWLTKDLSIDIAEGDYFPKSDIVVINYEIAQKHRSSINSRIWHLLVFDECHRMSNPDALRTLACLGDGLKNSKQLPIAGRQRLFLSGTPITKRPVGLWPICRIADPTGLGSNWKTYTKRYCGGWDAPWGYDTSGRSNLEELQSRLRASFMIRRVKEDVLSDLPPSRKQIITIPASSVTSILKGEEVFLGELLRAKQKAELTGDKGFDTIVKSLTSYNTSFEGVSKIRHETGVAKIPYVIDSVKDTLEEEQKVVIFAHHRDVIAGIAAGLKEFHPVTHYGDVSLTEKQKAIDLFNTDDKTRVFIGSISGAEGYSVAVASYALFAEFDWVGKIMEQAEERLWLLDKKDSILYQYLVFDGSIDSAMAKDYVDTERTLIKAVG